MAKFESTMADQDYIIMILNRQIDEVEFKAARRGGPDSPLWAMAKHFRQERDAAVAKRDRLKAASGLKKQSTKETP